MFTNILGLTREFSPFGPAGSAGRSPSPMSTQFCRSVRATRRARSVRRVRREADASTRGPWSERPQRVRRHAAALRDGHVLHDADRLASARARRAAAVRDLRLAGTASPVPAYISSGVCPRNAECGSTVLYSWT
jgi:hypothetical protein